MKKFNIKEWRDKYLTETGAVKTKKHKVDESLALSIAGGIVLGLVGTVALVKGAKTAKNLAGIIMDKASDKVDAFNAAKRAAEKLKNKKAILIPIAEKFKDDARLKKMYAELTPYMGTSNAKNRAAAKVRTKELTVIAKYIKTKLTPEELRYFADLSKYLRTGTFENL